MADNALPTFEWLEGMGVTVPAQGGVPGITFGGSHEVQPEIPRAHWTDGVWLPLEQKMEELGAEVILETGASRLVVDSETSEVAGIVSQDGKSYGANKAVILATGGFAHNPALMKENMLKG